MVKVVRVSLLVLLLALVISLPRAVSSVTLEGCPDHFACPPDSNECCCAKGVRCDLTDSQCEAWCAGQLNEGYWWW
jgi:hypothetical protein